MLSITRRRHTVMGAVMGAVMAAAGEPGTAARRVTRYRAAIVRRIRDPLEANGELGMAARRATPCRAVIVRRIEGPAAARRDGKATELTRGGRRLQLVSRHRAGISPRKFRA